MSFDVESLRTRIREFLVAPNTDLASVSRKQIRDSLIDENGPFTPELAKEHKLALKDLITAVFNEVTSERGEEARSESAESSSKRKREHEEEDAEEDVEEDGATEGDATHDGAGDDDADEDEQTPPPAKKKKVTSKNELTDAEMAKQLSSELNGRPRAARAAAPKPKARAKSTTKGRGKKKSADVVDSEDDSDAIEGGGKSKTKKKSSGGGGARGGFAKEYSLSEPLAAVLNVDKLSRPQVVKRMWEYIRENNLQNPNDKREIICDEKLQRIFNAPSTNMFKMNKTLSQSVSVFSMR
ncbi:SWIB-domain-containing protein [Punctularia strigosozonata HHB-11173 SS5]|uniref:SWIB-domain-containing protein n=1 Tax=Punctularia strigosozonata (strain HHB-11173) TaxID=741275 RepID=UPI0004416405|nr:SWIB-domain-containing protein [Punctularia strigosozonata HHB-11173 SS5]EIN06737.1 SWIB-domain-containing protein [Punctularia strigosozonata HHB-11173 SS5]